ncbi:MAG: DivIVA domain-containing protein [Nocardioidaceae bacterium]
MSSQQEQTYPYYRSPAAIRSEDFSHRMRGLDQDEVREYLNLLADQVKASDKERDELRAECERLRADLEHAQSEVLEHRASTERANEQSVTLLSQAQLVAEEMVEEVGRETRERMTQARSNERQILQEALETAESIRREAEAAVLTILPDQGQGHPAPAISDSPFARNTGSGYGGSSSAPAAEVEQVRSFARAAQAQMQQIMDALAAQVAKLGDADGSYRGSRGQDGISVAAWRSWQGDGKGGERPGPWNGR